MTGTIGSYRILDRIGSGGMGEVFRARDTKLGRTVALKIVPAKVSSDQNAREALLRDARAVSNLSHPNIAMLFEAGQDGETVFLAYEYVLGDTLRSLIGGRALNARRALDLAIQLADALAEAHRAGIVHGDLRPENVIVTRSGRPKVLDFGMSKWTAGGAMRRRAAATPDAGRTPVGVVAFMSPEQAIGEAIDHRSDVFSLGCILYEMLSGRLPFTAATPEATILQIVHMSAPPLTGVNSQVQPELEQLVQSALRKSLDARCQNAATVAATLRVINAKLETRTPAARAPAAAPSLPGSKPARTPGRAVGFLRTLMAHLTRSRS